MRLLFFGDVVGQPGRRAMYEALGRAREEIGVDFVVANGENAAGGFGITPSICEEFFDSGVDVITTGNHVWDQREIIPYFDQEPRLLRPHNYPIGTPGTGARLFTTNSGKKVIVINVMLRLFMESLDDPFQGVNQFLEGHRLSKNVDAILVDVHGEATSEKQAIAHMLDGKVSAVVGSHTHVPTADGRVLKNGTGFQTDAGMCGDYDSVIGGDKNTWVRRFKTRMPAGRVSPPNGIGTACGVLFDLDVRTGLSRNVMTLVQGPHLKARWPK